MLLSKLKSFSKITMTDISCTMSGNIGHASNKLIYPAASRNQEPILQVLKRFLIPNSAEKHFFLEVASGSGQHCAYFAPNFPQITFQPSEYDSSLLCSIKIYAESCPTKNILPPKQIDITKNLSEHGFKPGSIDYIYSANMIHISPYECTIGLFNNAGIYLKPDALMITYGPYAKDGVISPQSNVDFDASLRMRDKSWGLRDIKDLSELAEKNGLILIDTVEMPANNKTLVWKKN